MHFRTSAILILLCSLEEILPITVTGNFHQTKPACVCVGGLVHLYHTANINSCLEFINNIKQYYVLKFSLRQIHLASCVLYVQCSFRKFKCSSFLVKIIHVVKNRKQKSRFQSLCLATILKTQVFHIYIYITVSKHILTDFTAHLKLQFTVIHMKDF